MVEFAFVAVLFFTLLIGIISFGVLLAFKQNMTQAASESARASIAVVENPATPADDRKDVALTSMEDAIGEFDRQCYVNADCMAIVHECTDQPDFAALTPAIRQSRAALVAPPAQPISDPCMSTRIEFDNRNSRILPPFPLISAFEPDRLSSETTVRLVPVPDQSVATTTTTSTP